MLDQVQPAFKHIFITYYLLVAMLSGLPAFAGDAGVDLLENGERAHSSIERQV